mgnify:CR=1 FL=1
MRKRIRRLKSKYSSYRSINGNLDQGLEPVQVIPGHGPAFTPHTAH